MTKEQMVKYFTGVEMYEEISNELLQMHEEDLYFVLGIILPEGADLELSVKEIIEWQQINLGIMKK
jgi:hypothetical protein